MKTVSTKAELEQALKAGETHLMLKGELSKAVSKKKSRSKAAKIGGAVLAVGGVLAAIPTGGASLGATAFGLTIGTVTITAAELAILLGGSTIGSAVILAILKGRRVKLKKVDPQGNAWEMEVFGKSQS